MPVVAMSHNAEEMASKVNNVDLFTGFPNSEEDRKRLIAYLADRNLSVKMLIYN